jgi:hypothetical protein
MIKSSSNKLQINKLTTANKIRSAALQHGYHPVFSSFFPFGVLHLMLPEAPQPYGLLYYPRIGLSNFLYQFRAATPPEQRKLEL